MSKKYLDTIGLNKLVANIISRFADKNHNHSAATTTQDGFMSANDKVKLDGIADGANKTVVDSALSDTSINPIQNKVVKKALDGKVGNVNDGAVTISATSANASMIRETSMTLSPFGGISFTCDNGNVINVNGHSVITENDIQLNAVMTTGNGNAYEASVNGIDAYTIDTLPAGTTFTMIPHVVSTNVSPTLNVNNLGAKPIRQRLSNSTQSTVTGVEANWLAAGKPVDVMYDGQFWVVDFVRPNMASVYGMLPVANGGVPSCTTSDNGKFLRVVNGVAAWSAIASAENASF